MIKGLYVHIPFCRSICGYSDFTNSKYSPSLANRYLDHLEKEISLIDQAGFDSVYIGGGTPTALSAEQLERLLKMLCRFEVKIEYTIEINPETFDLKKARLLKEYGINRVSIGVQSFNEGLLEHMQRSHHNIDVYQTFKYLDEVGIKNRSIDLMYGFNRQTLSMLLKDLETAVRMDITHISIYDLEVYPHTAFGLKNYQPIDAETDYLMYASIVDYLNSHSFQQYETSNFAIGKYRSYHNQLYWHYEDFIGVGLGASGKIKNKRYDNTKNFVEYFKDNYKEKEYPLTLDDIRFEAVMMGLRLLEGINIADYNRTYETNLLQKYDKAVQLNVDKGLLEIENGYLKTSERGIFVLNDILVDFMD